MSSISSKALDVYCDEVVRDAVEKKQALRKENESLEPFHTLLDSIQIHHGGELLKEIKVLDSDEQIERVEEDGDDEEYLAFSLEDIRSFPYEDLYRFDVTICGLRFSRNPFHSMHNRKFPKVTVLWDAETPSAQLVFHLLNHVKVTGILTDFSGTLDDFQKIIDWNQFAVHNMSLGMTSFETGRPSRFRFEKANATLEGAKFTPTKLEILKNVLEPAISCCEEAYNDTESDQIKEIQVLAEANSNHEQLRVVAEEFKTLVSRNAMLKSCRNLIDSIVIEIPEGSSIRFSLENGEKCSSLDGTLLPEWRCEPLGDSCSIPLSAIADLQIKLAGMPSYSDAFHVAFTQDPVMIVSFRNGLSAIFGFDHSISLSEMEELGANFLNYIHSAVMQPSDRERAWTMRLLCLQFPMGHVETHLELLGVDMKTGEDEEDSSP